MKDESFMLFSSLRGAVRWLVSLASLIHDELYELSMCWSQNNRILDFICSFGHEYKKAHVLLRKMNL